MGTIQLGRHHLVTNWRHHSLPLNASDVFALLAERRFVHFDIVAAMQANLEALAKGDGSVALALLDQPLFFHGVLK